MIICRPSLASVFLTGYQRIYLVVIALHDIAFWPAKPQKTFSGQLQPGEWAYFSILPNDVAPSNNFSVKFLHDGGHPILLAKQGGYPTLTDYYLKFTDSSLEATASNVYQVDRDSLSDGNLILAVFNVDYRVQGELQFEIVILGKSFDALNVSGDNRCGHLYFSPGVCFSY